MKKKLILAALLMSMTAVAAFADDEIIFESQAVVEEDAADEAVTVFDEPAEAVIVVEDTDGEETAEEEIAFEENAEVSQEESVFEETVTEELVAEETSSSAEVPYAVSGLVYTGEPQELVVRQEGDWTYSLDGERFSAELPTAVNAGEYTVYMKAGDAEATAIVVTIAKADVTFTPPVQNTTE